jgi:hypothetical protein
VDEEIRLVAGDVAVQPTLDVRHIAAGLGVDGFGDGVFVFVRACAFEVFQTDV